MKAKFLIAELIISGNKEIKTLIPYVELVTPISMRPHDDGAIVAINGKTIDSGGLTEMEKIAATITTVISLAYSGIPLISEIYDEYCELLAMLLKSYSREPDSTEMVKKELERFGDLIKTKFGNMGIL